MTPDDLERLVLEAKDGETVRLAFRDLDEKARKKLSTAASALHRQLFEGKASDSSSERLKAFLHKRAKANHSHWQSRPNANASLAVFAVGPLSAVKKWQMRPNYEDREVFRRLLADRRPEWLGDWIDHELRQEWTPLEFPLIRSLVRDGLIAKPESDGYYRLYAAHFMRTGFYGRDKSLVPPLSRQLIDDPDLIDDIEGLFRVETNAFNTNSWLIKGAPEHYETWPQALLVLAREGHYGRGRLLDLALGGLQADIKQNQLSGYHKFFRLLAPDTDELVARQLALVALLCHPVGHVAKFAIETLALLEKAGKLDDDAVLRELPSVFSGEGKGNGIAALRLLDRIVQRTGKSNKGAPDARALSAVIEGLRHAHGDVQAAAIALLTARAKALDAGQWQEVGAFAGFMAPSNGKAMRDLMALGGDAVAPAVPGSVPQARGSAEPYAPDMAPFGEWRVLDEAHRLAPVRDLQELMDLAFHCAELVEDIDAVERLLDGMARLADQRPPDFADRVDPLIHRLNQRGASQFGLASASPGIAETVRSLVLTWATGELRGAHKREVNYYTREDAFVPLIALLHEVSQSVHRREPRQLLCAPTHKDGWIDPLVWAERLERAANDPAVADTMDFRLSLLRLAPDRRDEALARLAGLGDAAGRLARFALGGDEAPGREDRQRYAAWLTAARARDPLADWTQVLEPLAVDDPWPGGAVPAMHRWHSGNRTGEHGGVRWKSPVFEIGIERAGHPQPAPPRAPKALLGLARLFGRRSAIDWQALPTAAVHQQNGKPKYEWYGDLNTNWVVQWLPYVWPQHPAYAHYRGVRKLIQRIDDNTSNWTPSHGFFRALFAPGRAWGEAGHLLAVLGLVGKDADARGLAVDAVIEAIDARRFDPALFADVLQRLAAGEWVKLNRLGENLKPLVQVSPLHADAIGAALEIWLPTLDLTQRNAFHVLEILAETQGIAPRALGRPARAALEAQTGKSKTAKLAQQVLAVSQGMGDEGAS